jgi:hypothetical protein
LLVKRDFDVIKMHGTTIVICVFVYWGAQSFMTGPVTFMSVGKKK